MRICPPCLGIPASRFDCGCTVLALLFGFTCVAEAQPFNILEDDFTRVTVDGSLPRRTSSTSSPHQSVADEVTIGGPTAFDFSATAAPIYPSGDMDASGFADFGVLKAKINFSGPSAIRATVRSDFNDIYTVAPPFGVAPGTPGSISFVYFVDGVGDATGLPGETPTEDFSVATVGMQVVKTASDGGNPPNPVIDFHDSDFAEVINSQSLGGGVVNQVDFSFARFISFDVPFEYGVPFALRTELAIVVETDNEFFRALFNPYRELWGGGVIQNIFVDIFNTAELTAIVNETNPEAEVHGVSFDYSPLVTNTFPTLGDADFDEDGDVDGMDFLTWQQGFGIDSNATLEQGDADGNGVVNDLDLDIWQQQFGAAAEVNSVAVPELSTLADAIIILVLLCLAHWARQ